MRRYSKLFRKIGFTIASIFAAISSAGMRFGVPCQRIDRIARVERTFSYAGETPKGLLLGKKATFVVATGGIYDARTQRASFNFVEPYLKSVFGFLGVKDTTFLTAGGTKSLNQGLDRKEFLASHLQAVQQLARALQEVHA